MIFEKITLEEKEGINSYITNYVGTKLNHYKRSSLNFVLREWEKRKESYLYKLLGRELIISKDFVLEKDINSIADAFEESFDSNSEIISFINRFRNICCDRWSWKNHFSSLWKDEYYNLTKLIESSTLAKNKYSGPTFKVELDDGKTIAVQHGCKPVKTLGKFAKAWDLPGFEDFRICCSQILNDKRLTGELCLSIHPLDYMTMSDNNCGWSSCMSWNDYGCYRQGTVEMMNSPYVIVAYLKSKNPFHITDDLNWNSKKWRCLFIVDKEVIIGIKGYPYDGYQLQKEVLKWISELAKKNLNWNYSEKIYTSNGYIVDNSNVKMNFETYAMYNDFGNDCNHYLKLCSGGPVDNFIDIVYSGESECMWCGSFEEFENEGSLICDNCDDSVYCYECGERIDEESAYLVNGDYYCSCCYEEYIVTDPFSETDINVRYTKKIYLIEDDDEELTFYHPYIRIYDSHDEAFLSQYIIKNEETEAFFRVAPFKDDFWNRFGTYVKTSDLTEDGLKAFKEYSIEE